MAVCFENLGLTDLVARPEDALRLTSLVISEGQRVRGYRGDYHRCFGGGAGFAPGDSLHAMVVDDSAFPEPVRPLTLRERFERAVYLMDKSCIRAVYSQGRKVVG